MIIKQGLRLSVWTNEIVGFKDLYVPSELCTQSYEADTDCNDDIKPA